MFRALILPCVGHNRGCRCSPSSFFVCIRERTTWLTGALSTAGGWGVVCIYRGTPAEIPTIPQKSRGALWVFPFIRD